MLIILTVASASTVRSPEESESRLSSVPLFRMRNSQRQRGKPGGGQCPLLATFASRPDKIQQVVETLTKVLVVIATGTGADGEGERSHFV